jgi:hypothetical protein
MLTIEVLLIGLPCHVVHTGRGVALHRVKRRSQHGAVDMVQKRGELSFFLCRAAVRTRSSAWDTLTRSCARRVLCWPAFPLVAVPRLREGRLLARPAPPRIAPPCSPASRLLRRRQTSQARASPATTPHLPDADRRRPPAGQTRDLPVPVQRASAHARVSDHAGRDGARDSAPPLLPSALSSASAPGSKDFSRLSGWPMRSPVNASPSPSQISTHDSGPVWFAGPSL